MFACNGERTHTQCKQKLTDTFVETTTFCMHVESNDKFCLVEFVLYSVEFKKEPKSPSANGIRQGSADNSKREKLI